MEVNNDPLRIGQDGPGTYPYQNDVQEITQANTDAMRQRDLWYRQQENGRMVARSLGRRACAVWAIIIACWSVGFMIGTNFNGTGTGGSLGGMAVGTVVGLWLASKVNRRIS